MPPTTRTARTASRLDAISAHVALLTGTPSQGELLELRFRRAREGMARRFYPASRPAGLIEAVERLGRRTDVFLGCALRARRAGTRDAVAHSWVLWAECDTPTARETLQAFTPPPTLVIASGSPHGRHAYWALTAPVTAETLENANLRVAHALSADLACVDAARILRPPNTLNFKRDRPTAVTMLTHRPDRHYGLDELVGDLPDVPARAAQACGPANRPRSNDPLLSMAPGEYVPALLGQAIGRDRKVSCPFHSDTTPSLHAYPDHWYCFGCRRGGTVYDLAGPLLKLSTRGPEFLELRDRLLERFPLTDPRERPTRPSEPLGH